ncbi:MAG: TIR domain-containing protein [Lentisphaeria bacterium]
MAKRVYFAFHYQDVIDFRANVVRKHNVIEGVEEAGYYDASIWEEAKKKGDLALKRMINSELERTSVTAVLIGTNTYARPWVRYEILKSVERRNKIIGIHINSVKGKDQQIKHSGANPFDFLCILVSPDGKKATPYEFNGSQWVIYSKLNSFDIPEQPSNLRGTYIMLSQCFSVYDWVSNDGYNNFERWVE